MYKNTTTFHRTYKHMPRELSSRAGSLVWRLDDQFRWTMFLAKSCDSDQEIAQHEQALEDVHCAWYQNNNMLCLPWYVNGFVYYHTGVNICGLSRVIKANRLSLLGQQTTFQKHILCWQIWLMICFRDCRSSINAITKAFACYLKKKKIAYCK